MLQHIFNICARVCNILQEFATVLQHLQNSENCCKMLQTLANCCKNVANMLQCNRFPFFFSQILKKTQQCCKLLQTVTTYCNLLLLSRAIIEGGGFTNSRTVHAQTMRIILFFVILHQNDAEILGTRRRSGPVPHPNNPCAIHAQSMRNNNF